MAKKSWRKDRILNELEQTEGMNEALSLTNYELKERLADLELGLEDVGWAQLSGDSDNDLTREGIKRIADMSRMFFLKNPLIRRAVLTQSYYVYGQSVQFKGDTPETDTLIHSFLADPDNQKELTSHQSMIDKETELQVEGNIFFVFFPNPVTGEVKLRSIPPREIQDVIRDPNDSKSPMWYLRRWMVDVLNERTNEMTREMRAMYYPDIDLKRDVLPDMIGDIPVSTERVYHIKTGGLPDMKFGVPETWAGLDWARAYKTFLENWATIQRALSRFAAKMTTPGGSKGVTSAKDTLNTTQSVANGTSETNPPSVTGSTIVTTPEGIMFEPIRTAGMTTGPEEGRRLLLMVAAATGLPETFFGDLSQGNHATALTMDRPTELKFVERRKMWSMIWRRIFTFVAEQNQRGIDNIEFVDEEQAREAVVIKVDITWPPILEHEIDKILSALATAMDIRGMPERTMAQQVLSAFGIENQEAILDKMFPGENDGQDRPEEKEPVAPATNAGSSEG